MTAREAFVLDPEVTFLNHGSFGACPRVVLEAQAELRALLEREPVQFFLTEYEPRLEAARSRVAAFVGAPASDIAFVRNATAGVNAVLRSVRFAPGEQILVTDHGYNACSNAVRYVAERSGAEVVVVTLPWPVEDPADVVRAIASGVTGRTRLALVDHITSATGMVLPIASVVNALAARGVDTLVDGAHGPGMLELELEKLGAAYYTANFHKWTCAPKGAGLLYVRPDRQADVHPAVISHGLNSPRPRSKFLEEFDWIGTDDPSPWLALPTALDAVPALLGDGATWADVRAHNRDLVLRGRAMVGEALGVEPPVPEPMIGSLAVLPLPDGQGEPAGGALLQSALQQRLFDEFRVEVPIPAFPAWPKRLVRISAHLHNAEADYRRLAEVLPAALATER